MNKNAIIRNTIALIAGVFATMILVIAIKQLVVFRLYPPPAGLDFTKPEVQAHLMLDMPRGALILVAADYLVSTLAGAYLAARLSFTRHRRQGWLVGGLMLAEAILELKAIPHPHWFWAAALIAIALGAWLGAQLARPRVSDWDKE